MFHNANFFGSCIIHILYTECAEIKKKNNSGAKGLNKEKPYISYAFSRTNLKKYTHKEVTSIHPRVKSSKLSNPIQLRFVFYVEARNRPLELILVHYVSHNFPLLHEAETELH